MARARQSVTFTDLLAIASRLPWKVSLGVAALSLLALHLLAAAFALIPTVTTVADMGGGVIHQAIHMGAFFFQFVVPPPFSSAQAQRVSHIPTHAGEHHAQRVMHSLNHFAQCPDH